MQECRVGPPQILAGCESVDGGVSLVLPSDGAAHSSAKPAAFRSELSDEMLRLVVESCPSGLVMVDSSGAIVLVNAETERLFGYPREELLGRSVDVLVPERFRGGHPGHRAQYASEPTTRAMGVGRDLFGLRRDGSEFPVEIGLNPIRMPDGDYVLSVIVDITERKLAEKRFHLAVESCPSGMVMVDEQGEILLVNAETERMFGYARGELVGQRIELLVPQRYREGHPEHRKQFAQCPARRAMGAGRNLYGLRKDGSEFPVEIGLNPIPTDTGIVTLSVIVDISERQRIDDALANHARELQRSNEDLEQFAYVASHDLQEPLRMVASYTQLLADRYEGQLDAKADKYIHYAVEGARRMQQLVGDLLAYSRVGTQGKRPQPTDIAATVRATIHAHGAALQECGGTIDVGPLPTIDADPAQMAQLFQNLIGNALKFRGEDPPRIRIEASREGAMWHFSVADNGIGIEQQYWERIFQVFQRLHERGRFEGNGIGLAISKKIVERHGGHIWLESAEGVGTTFHFTLPAAWQEYAR
ncbi:MAG: PAS domain S-box protein [Candidatus Sumerlaeia bacterium]|nr:PAS domain S-box protein [Candidatus Sumerlaeia bacterium]